jgi:hypothetical protein
VKLVWQPNVTRVQKASGYQKIIGNSSAAKFKPSEDLANTFGLKLLRFRNYFEIIANLEVCKRTF